VTVGGKPRVFVAGGLDKVCTDPAKCPPGELNLPCASNMPGCTPVSLDSTETYDPVSNAWTSTADIPNPFTGGSQPTFAHTATVIENGHVVIAGGTDVFMAMGSAAIKYINFYDPVTDSFSGSTQFDKRYDHTATTLRGSAILLAGGLTDSGDLSDAN